MSVLIVGLSGVTNGGKTTLCNNLLKFLPTGTKAIYQDEFFLPEDSPLHVPCLNGIDHHNWEVLSSLDMDRMVDGINKIVSEISSASRNAKDANSLSSPCSFCKEESLLRSMDNDAINEKPRNLDGCQNHRGILLVDGFTIYDDHRLKEMCNLKFFLTLSKEECYARRLTRNYDPPDPPGYFEKCVWPMYEGHLERVKKLNDVDFIQGENKKEDILGMVLRRVLLASLK